MTNANLLLKAALKLPRRGRAAMAEKLLESLVDDEGSGKAGRKTRPKSNKALEAVIDEAEKDWRSFQRGEMGGTPAKEFIQSLRKKSKRA